MFNRFVYYQYVYNTSKTPVDPASDVTGITQSAGTYPVDGADGPTGAEIASGYQDIMDLQNQDTSFTPPSDELLPAKNAKPLTFIRSEYSTAKGVLIEKVYSAGAGNVVETKAPINVTVTIKNISGKLIKDAVYLEEPDPIISLPEGLKYTMQANGKTTQGLARVLEDGEYTYGFDGLTLAPESPVTITYAGVANPVDI